MTVYDSESAVKQIQYADHLEHASGSGALESNAATRVRPDAVTLHYLRAIAVGLAAVAAALEDR